MGELRLPVARRKRAVAPGRNHPSTIKLRTPRLRCISAQSRSSPSCAGAWQISWS